MLKRIAFLFILAVYIGTTAGFAMSLHFCGNEVSNIRINTSSQKPCCSMGKETQADTCCKDKQIEIKVTDQQQVSHSAKIPAISSLEIFTLPETFPRPTLETVKLTTRLSEGEPPVTSNIPLTIRNCVFQI